MGVGLLHKGLLDHVTEFSKSYNTGENSDVYFVTLSSDYRYDIIFPPDGMWGSLVDGVWYGFPRQLQTKVIKLRFYFLT